MPSIPSGRLTGTGLRLRRGARGTPTLHQERSSGVGADIPLVESPMNESVEDWSKDGKFIAFEYGKDSFQDIYALPLDADRKPGKPFPVVQGHYQKNEPQFSKDGKWLAYVSDENEANKFQVYVLSFPVRRLEAAGVD